MLRDVGLVPTIQRLAVLDCLTKSKLHPTADQVLLAVRKRFPSISRATVYNTLDALTKAGMVLRLNVNPTAARYDANLSPHDHFRCRVCQKVYDIAMKDGNPIDVNTDGHLVESVRTYAYGVCASCREKSGPPSGTTEGSKQTKESSIPSASVPPLANQTKSFQKKESQTPSSSGPPSEGSNQPKETKTRSASAPPLTNRKGARNA